MTREELRDYVEEQRNQDVIPYHVYSALIDGIDTLDQEMCEDCISREEAIRLAEQGQIQGYEWQFKKLCTLPSVTSQPKIGHWISLDDFRGKYNDNGFMCSECGEHSDFEENFCSNCGCRMVERTTRE